MIVVEFTVEPFVDGEPGAHVTGAIAAIEAMGLKVEIGPFGSSFLVSADRLGDALDVLVTTAYSHGATRVFIDTQQVG